MRKINCATKYGPNKEKYKKKNLKKNEGEKTKGCAKIKLLANKF